LTPVLNNSRAISGAHSPLYPTQVENIATEGNHHKPLLFAQKKPNHEKSQLGPQNTSRSHTPIDSRHMASSRYNTNNLLSNRSVSRKMNDVEPIVVPMAPFNKAKLERTAYKRVFQDEFFDKIEQKSLQTKQSLPSLLLVDEPPKISARGRIQPNQLT
jgi:hypothetical protein